MTVHRSSMFRVACTHVLLWGACLIALFPVLRVVSISFQNTDTISQQMERFPPRGEATAGDYISFFMHAIVPPNLIESFSGNETKAEIVYMGAEVEIEDEEDENENDGFGDLDSLDAQDKERYWYSNYVDLFQKHLFLQWIYNSLVISMSASLIGLFLAATTAYAFSRFDFPGKRIGVGFLLTTQMIPGPMMIIPIYLMIKSLGLGNSYAGLVIAMSVSTLPFSIMVLRGYFDTIPGSLEDAAKVDGCSTVESFFRILLPLSTPALAIAFLFNFTSAWSEFLLASTLIDDVTLRPWTLGLMEFSGNFDSRWGLFAAGSVVIAVPSVALFLYSSKWVISGLTLGGVKG